ncbi:MAG TPA: divergent polysaccharide deacetylase family protein [Candidatus Cloacimonetes bacterium]|nr:divergent polysaccharide deacetylase family protein [Candidatus Cloacimonadota bacterium]HEX37296.1 divergent polysaccharide deacetylase family protein [Candidatus Cloacimonadota bacterium]
MANTKRKNYNKKKQKGLASKYKAFLGIAVFIIIVFFIWQLIVVLSKPDDDFTLIVTEEPPQIESVEEVINYALQRLDIPDKFIKTYKIENKVYKEITIDSNQLSLTISNIFITDKVKEKGGQILEVEESDDGNRIEMNIFDPKIKKYYVLILKNDTSGLYDNITEISIVIDDFGSFGGELLQEFLNLPKAITFAILPDLTYSEEVMQKAYNQGRETIIHVPMEPESYPKDDPGKNAIYVDLDEKEIKKRMQKFIKQLPLCIGINNHMGSLATQYENVMAPVFEVLKEHDMFFLDSRTSAKTVGYSLAVEMDVPACERDVFLDAGEYENRVAVKTKDISELAERVNNIIVITHAKQKSLDELKAFLSNIEGNNIKLVPITDIVLPKEYVL